MRAPDRLLVLLLSLATLVTLATCQAPHDRRAEANPLGLRGTVPFQPLEKVPLALPDTRDRVWDFRAETDGEVALLFFGYTFCPDICAIHMATLAAALREVPPEVRRRVATVFVTVDPARDTPERLAGWLAAFDSSFVGLRGTEEEISSALAFYGYSPPETSGEEIGYTVSHPALVYAFTPDGLERALYGPETPPAVWAHDLPILAGAGATGTAATPVAEAPTVLARAGGIEVLDALVPRPPTAATTAVYMTLRNVGAEPDTLLGIETAAAERATLHDMLLEGGVMRMAPLAGGIVLPPGATVRLEPGARHGMLEGLSGLPEPGGTVTIVLRLARAGALTVPARVVRYEDVGR